MKEFISILNGWHNFIVKSEVTEKLAKQRAVICSSCIHKEKTILTAFVKENFKKIKGYKCKFCNCPLSPKIRSLNEKCPKKLW
jgi:hypothetical protein